MRLIYSQSRSENQRYVPVALGNGDLSFQIDGGGAMEQREYCGMTPDVVRAGIRYDFPQFPLISFGSFQQELPGTPAIAGFLQEFDPETGLCRCRTDYADGSRLDTTVFCHLRLNLIVIRKKRTAAENPRFRFLYRISPSRLRVRTAGAALEYEVESFQPVQGKISFHPENGVEFQPTADGRGIALDSPAGELTLKIAFDDEARHAAETRSAEELEQSSRRAWAEFYRESRLPRLTGRLAEAARMAEYHLRISSTRYAMPIGLFHSHWEGRYFAFDEYFMLRGLLAAGHFEAAKKIVDFHFAALPAARARYFLYFGNQGQAARFVWESIEAAGVEGSPPGHWLDHIFHMAHVALGAFDYCRATQDDEYLRQCGYPLLSACANFYLEQAVTPDGDRLIIGKCADLERLGQAKLNPFMTSCGAISTLERAAEAAEHLGVDPERQELWRRTAAALRKSLPRGNGRYLPCPDAEPGSSIALLSGLYPYGTLPAEDPAQRQAAEDYFAREQEFGNMYPEGNAICSWYANWKALALARLGRRAEARELLEQIAAETGCFRETFEILETGKHPYFTTAEGIFLEAICRIVPDAGHPEPTRPFGNEKEREAMS